MTLTFLVILMMTEQTVILSLEATDKVGLELMESPDVSYYFLMHSCDISQNKERKGEVVL